MLQLLYEEHSLGTGVSEAWIGPFYTYRERKSHELSRIVTNIWPRGYKT